MIYGFYSKFDSAKEIINQKDFPSLQEATKFFAMIKGLTLDQFHNLYAVTVVAPKENMHE